MIQVKIYGNKIALDGNRARISAAIHESLKQALGLPGEKKFHRFFALEPYDFVYPEDKSEKYLIIEMLMLEGQAVATKKKMIQLLYLNLEQLAAIPEQDVEIIINETPGHNWGMRKKSGYETAVIYKV
jgi:hypothetical protein